MDYKIRFFSLVILVAFCTQASAQGVDEEYFGEFSGEPKLEVKSNSNGRPTFLLLEDFSFSDPNGLVWETPKGWEVDGASIPQFAWSIVGGPLSGRYLQASIIHDRYCDIKKRTAHDTHRNFYYGMLANGVSKTKAKVMYWAVRTFGPSWKVVKRAMSSGIKGPPKYYRLETVRVDAPKISTEDAKTLIDGLDPNLDLEQLDQLSNSIRKFHESEALQTETPTLSPSELGIKPPDLMIKPPDLKKFFRF